MTLSLAEHLAALIAHDGPQPVSVLMELALAHPREGYYAARPALGAEGDFITAPEISQMFGEIIGAFALQTWFDLGEPKEWSLIELGPGRGTLAEDLIRTLKLRPQAFEAARFHFVEASPVLEREQRARLEARAAHLTWHRSLASVPGAPFFLIANEFFDALPVRQFFNVRGAWCERRLASGAQGFEFVLVPTAYPVAAEAPFAQGAREGAVIEISASARAIAREIGERLGHFPGRALIIDYGYMSAHQGDTLQAIARHRKVPVLSSLGEADLSAHVDLGALARAAQENGALAFGPIPQAAFLHRLGIGERHRALAARVSPEVRARLDRQLHRLTDADAMGDLFKVLALSSPSLPSPPGFKTAHG